MPLRAPLSRCLARFQAQHASPHYTLSLFKGTADEIALVDSGTTENFIDRETIKKLKLGTKKLETPVGLWNIDRTFNKLGQITHYLDLLVSRGAKKSTERFYVTDLRSD